MIGVGGARRAVRPLVEASRWGARPPWRCGARGAAAGDAFTRGWRRCPAAVGCRGWRRRTAPAAWSEANARPSCAMIRVVRRITAQDATNAVDRADGELASRSGGVELPRDGAPRAAARRPRLRAGASRRRAGAGAASRRRTGAGAGRARARASARAAESADGMFEELPEKGLPNIDGTRQLPQPAGVPVRPRREDHRHQRGSLRHRHGDDLREAAGWRGPTSKRAGETRRKYRARRRLHFESAEQVYAVYAAINRDPRVKFKL